MNRRSKLIVGTAAVVIGVAAAVVVMLHSLPSGWTWEAVSWRARLFTGKAEGRISGLSWSELWFMTHVRGGFSLEGFVDGGYSLEGAVTNPFSTTGDHLSGARIFSSHCAVCHGNGGSGGYGPSLRHPGLAHGDSDLAIYRVVRDGVSGTGMPRVAMSPQERWQVVGYLRTLQASASGSGENDGSPPQINIDVSPEQIRDAGSRTDQWLTYSGSFNGMRYTPLKEFTPQNVSRLQLKWIHQFGTAELEKSESTPIVVDGVIFATEPPATVVALEARSGAVIWRYSRSLPDRLPICCFRSNRGLAVLENTVFFGSLDDYLIALNADSGSVIWQTQVCRPSDGFTMTGAPLVAGDQVVVGVAGGEFGIRGFLAAYDAKTGQLKWRFNTIPGPGEFGHDTWKNNAWQSGGGPTWVTGSYDPTLDLIYWGVGNPAPGLQGDVRPGDNLFTDSELALHRSSGKLAWYFQFTPHDEHDWDAVQTPILADIRVDGVLRRALCVANRNGFYYVLDRTNGQFLLGVPFVTENWAKGLNSAGRPILAWGGESSPSDRVISPGAGGGVNWENAAFDPVTGTIFIPATEGAAVFTKAEKPERGDLGFYPGSSGSDYVVPEKRVVRALDAATGTKKWERWESSLPGWRRSSSFGHDYSGLLATGGGLVFGGSSGYVFAIDSTTGHQLWSVYLGGATAAAPISLTVDGHQVLLISAGRALFMFGL